jgi:hypothetical protein
MATVKEEQKALGEMEKNLSVEQHCLEKHVIEYDEKVMEKEHLITKVNIYIFLITAFYQSCDNFTLIGRRIEE